MRRHIFTVFLMLFALSILPAQESEGWFYGKNISKIEFKGLKNVKKTDLASIENTFTSIAFTDEVYEDLLDRINSLEYFSSFDSYVNHDPKNDSNIILTFEVEERPIVSLILFTGNQKIRNGELRDVIKTKASDIYLESKILIDERLIRDYYIGKGYSDSVVSHKIEDTDSGKKVTFIINEGKNTVIKEIHTTGNTVFSERSLKSKISMKEVGFLKDGAFQASAVEQDKRQIISLYQEKGYVDASIQDVKIDSEYNEEKQRQELIITFVINEGTQYTYKGMTISGNEIFSESELSALMKLKVGSVFNAVKFQEGLMNIQSAYVDNGYMQCQMYPVPSKNIETREISYNLTIVESSRSHVENIIISGNTKTKEEVIRREIPIEEGDVFSRDKVISGMRNLYSLQYFSGVAPDFQPGSESDLVDLVFNVEEQSTISLNFGLTFSGVSEPNDIPISMFAQLENSNLFGEGKSIAAKTTIAKNEQSIDFSYSQNWMFGLPISYSQSISFSHTKSYSQMNMFDPYLSFNNGYYYMTYDGWNAAIGTSFGRRWTPDFAILTVTGGMNNKITRYVYDDKLYTPADIGISTYGNKWGVQNTLWSSVSLDGRDISYNPSKGWFLSERLSWYGLIPGLEKEFFLKSDTKAEAYYTLCNIPVSESWSFNLVLAGYTNFVNLFPTNNTVISDSNRLYIDGMFNGRGWTELYKATDVKGESLWNTQIELRMPIVNNILGLDFFHDAIALKPDFNSMMTDLSLNDFYFSFGPALRILMPQFPLHLLFAFRYQYDGNGFKWADNPYQFTLSFNLVNK